MTRKEMLDTFNRELGELSSRMSKVPHGQDIIKRTQELFKKELDKEFPESNHNLLFDRESTRESAKDVAHLVEAYAKIAGANLMEPGNKKDAMRHEGQEEAKHTEAHMGAQSEGAGTENMAKGMMSAAAGAGGVSAAVEKLITTQLPQLAQEAANQAISQYQNANTPTNGRDRGPSWGDITGAKPNPNDAGSMLGSAFDKMFKGDTAGALEAANRAVGLGGGADALALRGGLELDQKQYSKALQDSQQALQLDPSNKDAAAVAHFAEGRSDGVGSDGPASAKAGEAPAGGAGGFSGGGSGLGGGFSGSGFPGSGSVGKTSGPGNSRGIPSGAALAGMSGVQAQKSAQDAFGMNDLNGAEAFVNRALAQDPKNPAMLNLRSAIHARRHDYAKAAEDAKAGLEISPKDPALLRSLGLAQLREKDYKGALATANEMLELDPNDASAYALRGHAYGSMGDRDAMMADLKRAAELDPSFRDAAAQMAGQVELPSDKDILFLFPGEDGPAAAKTAAPEGERSRRFGLLVGATALGGLLLALGLLSTVLAQLKEQVSSAFTRVTRKGPTLGAEVDNGTSEPASVNGLLPGLIRGQYEVSRQIGQGGMGLVFEGTDRSLGRRVAIKKMRDELRINPAERARFVIEAKTVAALHHPNIVDIYAIVEDGRDVYLVFEFIDGKTVHELVQTAGRLPAADALRITRASADALGYAHSRGVIHRDMKPSNVMVDAAGRVKVMDFGIARMAKDSLTRFSITNTVVGTPPYMAPEQEQGQVRRESDVYALAVCAYEMLTGKLPFIGLGAGMLMNKINMSFVAPSRATAGLPESLDEVFVKAFQADPDNRYRTPAEFAGALASALPASVRA